MIMSWSVVHIERPTSPCFQILSSTTLKNLSGSLLYSLFCTCNVVYEFRSGVKINSWFSSVFVAWPVFRKSYVYNLTTFFTIVTCSQRSLSPLSGPVNGRMKVFLQIAVYVISGIPAEVLLDYNVQWISSNQVRFQNDARKSIPCFRSSAAAGVHTSAFMVYTLSVLMA